MSRSRTITVCVASLLVMAVPCLGQEMPEGAKTPTAASLPQAQSPDEATARGECAIRLEQAQTTVDALKQKVSLLEEKIRVLEGKK